MSSAERYLPHYTVADYRLWDGDWELLNGIPIAMTPSPFGPHQHLSLMIARELLRAIEACNCAASVLQDIDWVVTDDTVLRPDVLVVCGPVPEKHVCQTPVFVAEILSDSTAERDLTVKKRLYQDRGVGFYLTVDPKNSSFELLELGLNAMYRLVPVGSCHRLQICDDCDLQVDFSSIFARR